MRACRAQDRQPICEPGDTIRHLYFPTSSLISLITPREASAALEVGLAGREGAFGLTVLLDIDTSPLLGLTQGTGSALRISAEDLRRHVKQSAHVRKIFHRYLYVLMAQVAQTAACSRFHRLDARLARWLLLTHDRVRGDVFQLTHAFLAHMLGVRRAGVTAVARRLQDQKVITYGRGTIRILDRKGLESLSCPCYSAFNAMYRTYLLNGRAIAPPPRRGRGRRGRKAEFSDPARSRTG